MKYVVTLNNKKYEVEVNESEAVLKSVYDAPAQSFQPAPSAAAPVPAASAAPAGGNVNGVKVTSPMPGTILNLNVTDGQTVKSGDVLLILEAMKMENEIVAPVNGTVKLMVSKGSTVDTDQILAAIQ